MTVILPGIGGDANWGGAAFDPTTRMLYVASRRYPQFAQANPVNTGASGMWYPYRVEWGRLNVSVDGLPIVIPPWSSITAYSLDSGDVVFKVPNAPGPKDHDLLKNLDLPDLGNIGAAPGLLVTQNLIFHDSSSPEPEPVARSKKSGEVLWRHPLPGFFAEPHPISYSVGERQIIAVGTGGAWEPSRVAAFALEAIEGEKLKVSAWFS